MSFGPFCYTIYYFSMKKIPALLEKVALTCWTSPKYRHLFFLFLTALIVGCYGYYFGTFDQSSHIPFLKKTIDPSLFPNDRFFDLRTLHYSYFWLLFVPFYKLGVLELTMFFVYVITTYLTFWAVWKVSKTLFQNPLTSLIAPLAAAFPHIGFSGFPLFEFSMLNRTVALPFELLAFDLYLKKKYIPAFLLLGVLYNFHALSVHFVLAMIGMDMLIAFIKTRNIKPFLAVPFFVLSALPVLIWMLFWKSGQGIQMAVNWSWFHLLNTSLFFHLFNFVSIKNPIVTLLSAGGIGALFLFFIAKKHMKKDDMHETVAHFMYGGIVVLIAQQLATSFFPLTIIIQAQVVRIGTFLTLFAYIYASHMISNIKKTREHFVCFLSALFLSFSPLILLISFIFWRTTHVKILRICTGFLIGGFLSILTLLFIFNVARPGIYIWPEKTAFYDVQLWAKNNTNKNTLFITPPSKWGLYDIEWRVVSERSTVSTLSELLEGAFDPNYIPYWKERFEDVAPGARGQFEGNYLTNLRLTDSAFYSNSSEQFIALGKKYYASYLVVENPHQYTLPIVYKNKEYTVYNLTHQAAE